MLNDPSILRHKTDFRERWLDGRLGNRPRVWTSVKELGDSNFRGEMSLRIHLPGSQHTVYGVPFEKLGWTLRELAMQGVDVSQVWFNESAPDHLLILQGEYFHGGAKGSFLNRYLMYSTAKYKMKRIMDLPRYSPIGGNVLCDTEGLATDLLLQSVMTPYSWEEFSELRERFPDHSIEFGVYGQDVGTSRGCNHFIWEVRQY
jgi:hypothetical protein